MTRVLVTSVPGVEDLDACAALRACRLITESSADETSLVVEFGRSARAATVVAGAAAKGVEASIRSSTLLPEEVRTTVRGRTVFAAIGGGESSHDLNLDARASALAALVELVPRDLPVVVAAPPSHFRTLLELESIEWDEVLIRETPGSDPTPGDPPDALTELAVAESRDHADLVEVSRNVIGPVERRRVLAGRNPTRLFQGKSTLREEQGQASPLVLGAVFVLVLGAMALVAIGGAITGKARGQRAADLSALSAARSMKADLPRLVAPPTLPNGAPNPYHMTKAQYLIRARTAALRNAVANSVSPGAVTIRFPDQASPVPVRVRVSVGIVVAAGGGSGQHRSKPVWTEALVLATDGMGVVPQTATGGGYSGPLASRQGHGLRPDVAAAFDVMAAAAARSGVALTINSAFRSDAEQARLFAANPDPRMVARPGTSLHRCGTELDLGPPSAYSWLAANAGRFGFVQRYSWEPWHWGFQAGPAPCSATGARTRSTAVGGRGDPPQGAPTSLPSFVPARFRPMIIGAAARWNVSAPLLAAQLDAESGFDPNAVSPAGARGIAQFMPGTAAAYGLANPFDPRSAIMAQAHLMSDLLKQFGSPALALAAYNAGPGAVSSCRCIPPYPETQAYVAKILARVGGAGAGTSASMRTGLAT